jgi:DNA-directed RNA polymerase specialized sigma24 family protein
VRADSEFERLYETEVDSVFRTAFLLCRDREVAEDATQEAFARALERWSRPHGESWAGGWVMSTAINVCRRMLRRGRRIDPPANPGGADAYVVGGGVAPAPCNVRRWPSGTGPTLTSTLLLPRWDAEWQPPARI